MPAKIVVLDAMGVLYRDGDDVAALLIPYVRGLGCAASDEEITEAYRRCSLGGLSSAQLWRRLGVDGDDEEYCAGHALVPGITDLLDDLVRDGVRLACLSNDVSEWSVLLRRRFGLDRRIGTWVISGDIGVRKPDPDSYRRLLDALGAGGEDVLFVDDNPANVRAAQGMGISAVLFAGVADLRRRLSGG